MTPFMLKVAEIVGTDVEDGELPVPQTRPSVVTAVNVGADRQVAIRSLAEQLVCEANAVLDDGDDHMTLVDELGPDDLTFSIHYRGRQARVSTRFSDGLALGQVVGDGVESTEPRELAGPDALPDLVLLLLLESQVIRHPSST